MALKAEKYVSVPHSVCIVSRLFWIKSHWIEWNANKDAHETPLTSCCYVLTYIISTVFNQSFEERKQQKGFLFHFSCTFTFLPNQINTMMTNCLQCQENHLKVLIIPCSTYSFFKEFFICSIQHCVIISFYEKPLFNLKLELVPDYVSSVILFFDVQLC